MWVFREREAWLGVRGRGKERDECGYVIEGMPSVGVYKCVRVYTYRMSSFRTAYSDVKLRNFEEIRFRI